MSGKNLKVDEKKISKGNFYKNKIIFDNLDDIDFNKILNF